MVRDAWEGQPSEEELEKQGDQIQALVAELWKQFGEKTKAWTTEMRMVASAQLAGSFRAVILAMNRRGQLADEGVKVWDRQVIGFSEETEFLDPKSGSVMTKSALEEKGGPSEEAR